MTFLNHFLKWCPIFDTSPLSSKFWARQAQREVVKIKFFDFAYWAWSTPWGHVLSPITFCRNPVLSWAIRYSVFQKVDQNFSKLPTSLIRLYPNKLGLWFSWDPLCTNFKNSVCECPFSTLLLTLDKSKILLQKLRPSARPSHDW